MALETATYISGLVAVNPLSTDPKSQGDDHLRLIKSVLLNSFPGVSGAVTATHTELNYVAGVTSGIQSQLNAITAQLAGGVSKLSSVTAASADASISNAAYQIKWQWKLTSNKKAFWINESAASTGGTGTQDLLYVNTQSGSSANALRVTTDTVDALLISNGRTTLKSQDLQLYGSDQFGKGGSINISAGASSSDVGGDILISPGSGPGGKGKIIIGNASVYNGAVACAFTANQGPNGASTSIAGWLNVLINGTNRYIPYW